MSVHARASRSALAEWWWSVDRVALASVAGLIASGLLLSLAASPAAAGRLGVEPLYFLIRHGLFAAMALAAVLVISTLSPVGARRVSALALGAAALALLATVFVGHEVNGARRWIRIGSISVQASEFAKPGLVAVGAWLLARAFAARERPAGAAALAIFLVIAGLTAVQPDVGQTALLAASFAAVVFIAGAPRRWLAALGAAGAAAAVAAYAAFPHVRSRIAGFLNPEGGDTYQIDLAREAIARGGLFGVGPGEGVIKRTLPDAHTDFIFAVAAEEFGLIFALGLIALFALFIGRLLARARRLTDREARAAASGLAALIGLQAAINIAMALNLAPPKGMTLPFVSYGGSSLLAMGLAAGLALAYTRRRPGAFTPAR